MAAAIVSDDDGDIPVAEIGMGNVARNAAPTVEDEDEVLTGMKKRKDTKGGKVVGANMSDDKIKESARRERESNRRDEDRRAKRAAARSGWPAPADRATLPERARAEEEGRAASGRRRS